MGPLCGPGSEGSEGKVDGPSGRGLWPPDGGGLCSLALKGATAPSALRVVVSPYRVQIIKRGAAGAAGCVEGLCSLRSGGDSAFGAEGGGLPLRGNEYIPPWRAMGKPYNRAFGPWKCAPPFPMQGQNKPLYVSLRCHMWHIAKHP